MSKSNRLVTSVLRVVAGFVAVLALGACRTGSQGVARVGDTTIAAGDVVYRHRVLELRAGDEVAAHLALLQLLEEALMAEVDVPYITARLLEEE